MSVRTISTRACATGDEAAICDLFLEAFGRPMSPATWRWKYLSSPWADPGLSRVAVADDGRVVGHIGVAPVPLNVSGAQHRAGVVADFVAARDCRGLGLDRRLFVEAHEAMRTRRLVAGLSFPSDLAVAPLHHHAARVAMLEKYHLAVGGPDHERLRATFDATPEDERLVLDFDANHRLDQRYDALWGSCRKLESLGVWKDRRYLEWKYLQRPEAGARVMALTVGNSVAAICVWVARGFGAQILELVVQNKDVDLARQLLLRVADDAATHGVAQLRFIGHDPWFFAAAFAQFDRKPDYSHHVFVRSADPDLAFLYQNPINWTLTAGDHEAV